MRNRPVVMILLIALLVFAGGCDKPNETGPNINTTFTPDPNPGLGRDPKKPSPAPANPGTVATKPSAGPQPQEKPAEPEEQFFDVALIAESPYFEPGNELVMPAGHTLRVTNKDGTAERPTRSFTADNGAFDSGPLAHNQVWTYKFSGPGRYKVVDHKAPFIFGTLEVAEEQQRL